MTLEMLIAKSRSGALKGLAVAVLCAGFAATAKADDSQTASVSECGHFPKVALWQELSHDFVRQLVDERYQGDWDAYLAKLDTYKEKLETIHEQGQRARVTWRDRKISIGGDQLAYFLKLVEKRREVTQCLAGAETLADFSTAAGGDMTAPDAQTRVCRAIPQVEWWAFTTPEEIVDFVNRRHGGDFAPYLEKWDIRLKKLQDIYGRGSTAVTSTGLTLRGASLQAYMDQMRTRNEAVRCLAEKQVADNS